MTLIPDGPNLFYDPNEPITCYICSWSGTLSECTEVRVLATDDEKMALAGRDGFDYKCPACRTIVVEHTERMY